MGFRREVKAFMHNLKARERGLETELHVAKWERDALKAESDIAAIRLGEDRRTVRWEEPSWFRWGRLCFSRVFWRRIWQVQAFSARGEMRWYGGVSRGLPAIVTAEQIVTGNVMGYEARCIRVRNVETGRTAWYGFCKGD